MIQHSNYKQKLYKKLKTKNTHHHQIKFGTIVYIYRISPLKIVEYAIFAR